MAAALCALAGCQAQPLQDLVNFQRDDVGDPDGGGEDDPADAILPEALPAPQTADKGTVPGVYAADPRWRRLAIDWHERVDRAVDRFAIITGITFDDGSGPEIVLTPLGDERVPYELNTRIKDGRRSVLLRINAEPLVAGVLDPDRTLLRALGDVAFEDAARRHGHMPRWIAYMAGTAAAGDMDRQLEGLHRRAVEGDRDALVVSAENARAAQATAIAALLLLADRGQPGDVRKLLRFASDGDDPDALLIRLTKEAEGSWVGRARDVFNLQIERLNARPWKQLARARAAVDESGRAGLDAMLGDEVPPQIADEITVLRARASADEGAFARARTLLRTLSPDAMAILAEPAEAVALRIRVESRAGGDAALARRLAGELDRDFPRSSARAALRRDNPMLGMEEDPQRWMSTMRARIEWEGSGSLTLATIDRYARVLLQDHRAGAAQRFLDDLGPRREAPELAHILIGVEEAQREPSEAAQRRNATRVRAWRSDPNETTRRDVEDGGRAATPALLEILRNLRRSERGPALRLLVSSSGIHAAVVVLQTEWRNAPHLVLWDLEQLAGAVPYAQLRGATDDVRLRELGIPDVEHMWERVRLGLDPAWLARRPGFLQAVRNDEYAMRRAAFERLLADGGTGASPGLVAHGMTDSAALLRQIAVRLAGSAGFVALARKGLEDKAWLVREEAVTVVARLEGKDAVPLLIGRLRQDEAVRVRTAAAASLLRVAPSDPRALAALLRTQVEEEPRLRDAIATGLTRVPALPVARVIADAWTRAVRRREPSRGFLTRTALLFQRVARTDLGYEPEATRADLQRVLAGMRRWIARQETLPGGRDQMARMPQPGASDASR